MPNEEYDDGYDSAASFERAGADGPDDGEPRKKPFRVVLTVYPDENGELMRDPKEVLADLEEFGAMMEHGGESLGFGWHFMMEN